ncbi:hypothetical protein N7474_003107 [Penicillium riverlandense]|uniref:uncharacterized protein n=1 Tax=Penicillium riverlandense TaxID=1903569 RepID=UPI0025499A51|nr:uncharacterized protein N7474_003107 [Penicillium riverlandense]KAJ5825969.1 hypothetical protein N7474_003107 [Penicillium riverlandense]
MIAEHADPGKPFSMPEVPVLSHKAPRLGLSSCATSALKPPARPIAAFHPKRTFSSTSRAAVLLEDEDEDGEIFNQRRGRRKPPGRSGDIYIAPDKDLSSILRARKTLAQRNTSAKTLHLERVRMNQEYNEKFKHFWEVQVPHIFDCCDSVHVRLKYLPFEQAVLHCQIECERIELAVQLFYQRSFHKFDDDLKQWAKIHRDLTAEYLAVRSAVLARVEAGFLQAQAAIQQVEHEFCEIVFAQTPIWTASISEAVKNISQIRGQTLLLLSQIFSHQLSQLRASSLKLHELIKRDYLEPRKAARMKVDLQLGLAQKLEDDYLQLRSKFAPVSETLSIIALQGEALADLHWNGSKRREAEYSDLLRKTRSLRQQFDFCAHSYRLWWRRWRKANHSLADSEFRAMSFTTKGAISTRKYPISQKMDSLLLHHSASKKIIKLRELLERQFDRIPRRLWIFYTHKSSILKEAHGPDRDIHRQQDIHWRHLDVMAPLLLLQMSTTRIIREVWFLRQSLNIDCGLWSSLDWETRTKFKVDISKVGFEFKPHYHQFNRNIDELMHINWMRLKCADRLRDLGLPGDTGAPGLFIAHNPLSEDMLRFRQWTYRIQALWRHMWALTLVFQLPPSYWQGLHKRLDPPLIQSPYNSLVMNLGSQKNGRIRTQDKRSPFRMSRQQPGPLRASRPWQRRTNSRYLALFRLSRNTRKESIARMLIRSTISGYTMPRNLSTSAKRIISSVYSSAQLRRFGLMRRPIRRSKSKKQESKEMKKKKKKQSWKAKRLGIKKARKQSRVSARNSQHGSRAPDKASDKSSKAKGAQSGADSRPTSGSKKVADKEPINVSPDSEQSSPMKKAKPPWGSKQFRSESAQPPPAQTLQDRVSKKADAPQHSPLKWNSVRIKSAGPKPKGKPAKSSKPKLPRSSVRVAPKWQPTYSFGKTGARPYCTDITTSVRDNPKGPDDSNHEILPKPDGLGIPVVALKGSAQCSTDDEALPKSPDALEQESIEKDAEAPQFWSHSSHPGPNGQSIIVHYCRTLQSTEEVAQLFQNSKVVGFDMEWKAQTFGVDSIRNNVSLIQVANEERVALFQLASFKPGRDPQDFISPSLKHILECQDITKVGVSIKADCTRLRKYLGIEARSIFELSYLYRLVKYAQTNPKLVNKRSVNLSDQVEEHFGLPLEKTDDVRCGDWTRALNYRQVQYAAADPYACICLFNAMEAKRLAMDPVPPRPAHAELNLPIILPLGQAVNTEEKEASGLPSDADAVEQP